MGSLFSAPKPEPLPPAPTAEEVVAEDKAAAAEAAERERTRQRNLRGRQADIRSGPGGVTETAEVAKKTLLGE